MRAFIRAFLIVVVSLAPSAGHGGTDGVVFQQVAKLTATDTTTGDEFGRSVAIDGDRLIIGAIFDDDHGPGSGSAYIFERTPSAGWVQVAKLTAPDGEPGDWFGNVALSGDTALVAASVNDESRHGYAYIFERDAGGPGAWGPVSKLLAADGVPDDHFGSDVALGGDTAVVGAIFADGPGGGDDGAAYIFERDARGSDAWGQVAKLGAAKACIPIPDPTFCGWEGDDRFGASVALNGDTLLVGNGELAGDYAYLFKRVGEGPGSAWRRVARLAPSDEEKNGFAHVSVSGETVVVGASGDDDLDNQAGAAYVFEPDPGGPRPWREVIKLYGQDGAAGDYFGDEFGNALAVDAGTVVVGAPEIGESARGKAYVFRREVGGPGAWGAVARLLPAELESFDHFGDAVGVSGQTVVVGAYGDDDRGDEAGAVYVFEAARVEATGGISSECPGKIQAGATGLALGGQEDRLFAAGASANAEGPGSESYLDRGGGPPAELLKSEPDTWLAGAGSAGRDSRARSIVWAAPDGSGRDWVNASSGERPGHQPTLCFDFGDFDSGDACDGLELTLSGGTVTGLWRNTNCEGTDVPVTGTLEGGRVRVVCDAAKDPCPAGFTWSWIIDGPLDGTMDMVQLDGAWNSWIDELPYAATTGPCPFQPQSDP